MNTADKTREPQPHGGRRLPMGGPLATCRPGLISGRRVSHAGGFTLVELLVVILIISILIALLMPALAAAMRSARNVLCQSNLQQLYLSEAMYGNENQGYAAPYYVSDLGTGAGSPYATYFSTYTYSSYLDYMNVDYLSGGGPSIPAQWLPNPRLPKTYLCPSTVLAYPYLGSQNSDGTYPWHSYQPDENFFFCPETGQWADPRINDPVNVVYGDHVAPDRAIFMGEVALADNEFYQHGWWNVEAAPIGTPTGWGAYGDGAVDGLPGRFAFMHGNQDDPTMNVVYFDGHVASADVKALDNPISGWQPNVASQ